MKVYDGKDMILGRLASQVAKDLLLGEEVAIVNCESVVISGRKINTVERETQKRDRKGYPLKSAKHPRLPDRFVRRIIRGMLPWKFTRGKEAYKRVMCYRGVPDEFVNQPLITIKKASSKKLPTLRYMTVGEVCKTIGGKA
ncbi:MAG: 50S ribosomal protein L13 [archaeon]|nr:50S ribosomal protein L13 [archaeon]